MTISINDFEKAIQKSRCKDTAANPDKRSPENPSYTQCLATALVARDELGLSVCVESFFDPEQKKPLYHFFNEDTYNNEIRFCEEQFRNSIPLKKISTKALSHDELDVILEWNPENRKKYELLKSNFETQLYNNLIDSYIEDFMEERFGGIEELPQELLLPNHANYDKYKCRTIRRTNICIRLQILPQKLPSISDATKQEIRTFDKYIKGLKYSEFRTKEEIDIANGYLDTIITLLHAEKAIIKYKALKKAKQQ